MAIKELFQDSRPQVLFDPRASQRIDPRFKFTRNGTATYYDSQGVVRVAPANQPRVGTYEPDANGVFQPIGLLVEEARTNLALHSEDFSNAYWLKTAIGTGVAPVVTSNNATAPDGTSTADRIAFSRGTATNSDFSGIQSGNLAPTAIQYGGSLWIKAATSGDVGKEIQFRHVSSSGTLLVHTLTLGWQRIGRIETGVAGTRRLDFGLINAGTSETSVSVHAWGAQVEAGSSISSYIPTTTGTVTRPADLLSIDTDIPSSGSLYIDAQALDTSINTTLLSAANAANDKLLLQVQQPASLYGSTGLVYSVDGAFKPTLPFPVPGTTRERNLITWGANNNHYRADSARKTASSSTSVPANMTELGIGHDVTDPTKGFTGYINTVYMWPGEITPTIAEALVRGDIDVKDADVADPVPADTLAFVFNTQGTTTSGDKQVILPLRGSTNNILVSWGDNTSSALVAAAASVNVTKTYSAAGIYSVQITSDSDGTNEALENLLFFGNNPTKLFRVQKWGGTAVFRPTTMFRVFRDCTQLDFEDAARTELPDTSAITNWQEAFYNCNKISGTFPTFNTTAATTFNGTWFGCSSMTAFPFIESASVTNFALAWINCSSLTSFPLINTAAGTNFSNAWLGCSSLTSFPLINTAAGTNFQNAWNGCSSLTSFPLINTAAGTNFTQTWINCTSLTSFPLINTAAGTNFGAAWQGCSSLTSFPSINTAAGTSFGNAWLGCSSLTSFPLINTAAGTNFQNAWNGCSSLTSFPLINTAAGTNFNFTWSGCSSLTSFPLIDTSAITSFPATWSGCSSLTSFPLIDTSAGTSFSNAWSGCSSLTSFPLIDTSAGTSFSNAWKGCSSLTSFPLINTAAGTNFQQAWQECSSLTSFPLINTAAGTNFQQAWQECSSLTSFPLINTAAGTSFPATWSGCSSLTDFPAAMFDSCPATNFLNCWLGCALTAQSIENILVSINTAGTSNGNLTLSGGTNANSSTWSTAANNAYIALVGRGWTITQNGTAPS
jgi:hypothetical protein